MKEVIVYTTDHCSFCLRVKEMLTNREVPFTDVHLGRDDEGRDELWRRTGMMSFPTVTIGGEVLGGYRELITADVSGRLDELLAA